MARKVITLKGDPIVSEEFTADEALTPGHLLELTATGVKKQTDDAANVARLVALERDELGKEIGDAYASGDVVKVGSFAPGMRAYMFIPSGQNLARGGYLTSDTAGRLTATGVVAGVRIAMAVEAVNNSAGPGDARIRVEFV